MFAVKTIHLPDGFGPHRCHASAALVVSMFVALLEDEARRAGGTVSIEDVRRYARAFREARGELWAVYETVFQSCQAARAGGGDPGNRRSDHFGRLLTHTFSHLFPDGTRQLAASVRLPRRALPAFFATLRIMLGQDFVEAQSRRCDAIIARLRRELAFEFAWNRYFADAESQAVLCDTLVAIAKAFESFETRRLWFLATVNRLSDARSVPEHGRVTLDHFRTASWLALSESQFGALMANLFAPVDPHRLSREAWNRVAERAGTDGCEALGVLFRRLAAAGYTRLAVAPPIEDIATTEPA